MKEVFTIGFLGAPSVGKSAFAYGLIHHIKQEGLEAEFISELMKQEVMLGADNTDAVFNTRNALKQNKLENSYRVAPNLEYLVCETTTMTPYLYESFYGKDAIKLDFLKSLFTKYDILFYVRPPENFAASYSEVGRCEDYQTSIAIDTFFLAELKSLDIKVNEIDRDDYDIEQLLFMIQEARVKKNNGN